MTGFLLDIRRALFQKILHKKGKDLSEMYSGDMISRMNNDATDFVNLIFWSGLWGYSNLLHITFSVGFMFYYNIFLGIFTVILVPLVFFTSKYFKERSENINKNISVEQGKLSSYLFEIVKNLNEIKVLNVYKSARKRYLRKTALINKMKVENQRICVMAERMNTLIYLIAQLIIFVTCAYFIVKNKMKLGAFVSAVSYFNMAVNYFGSLNGKIVDMGKQNVSIQRVVDILNETEEDYKENIPHKEVMNGTIQFKNVTFSYNKGKPILSGINLYINGGSIIGVVGKSGAGKSTMANLLYNLYTVDSGELFIDGINVNEYNLHSLRSQVGIVHQETIIYDNTLRYNLAFSNNKDNDDALVDAIKKVALYDTFLSLPNGLDTLLGSNGYKLSSGQNQRLAIVRVIIKNTKILIFDESTSLLDSQNEALIRNVMSNLAKTSTIIIISHRFSTIKNCDKIVVLEDGVIQDFDTHKQLMKRSKIYIDLFREQCITGGESI